MSKKICGIVVFVGMCALSVLLLSCGSSDSRPAGTLYVETQGLTDQGTPGIGFNVTSYAINLNNGGLALVSNNSSTCTIAATQANNAPCGAPLDIFLDPTGGTAFVLNQGIPCIYQGTQCIPTSEGPATPPSIVNYTVNSDGSLSAPIAENYYTCLSATLSGTCTPPPGTGYDTAVAMTRDAAGQFLFVINEGVYPQPPSCPLLAAPAADPTDAGNFVGCPSISVFSMTPGKTGLTLVSQSSTYQSPLYLSKIPTGLSAITFTQATVSGQTEEILFVTENYDLCTVSCLAAGGVEGPRTPNDNAVSVYTVSSSGILSEQTPNSPYAVPVNNPISVLAVNTSPVGQPTIGGVFVYVGNGAGPGAVTPFQLCTVQDTSCSSPEDVTENLLVPVACPPQQTCSASAGQNPVAMVVDPTNNFLYVASNGGSSAVYGFRMNTSAGTLTPLTPPSQPTGSQPVGLALQPSVGNLGQFLYVSNSNSANITGFGLSTVNGTMSSPITVDAPPGPTGIAVH
ncbi:MAG: hypothetical protein ABSB87_19035 [Terriglobales bacterium]|jgi:hypothetical protein